jgi:hypothetical protein
LGSAQIINPLWIERRAGYWLSWLWIGGIGSRTDKAKRELLPNPPESDGRALKKESRPWAASGVERISPS